ncbi:hypothetical protein [Nonomuraea sp. NPDC003709]|uniref:hypothetical protein n=1 Tax=Nonomuraea sp. NPDC003709 TaxID=3154450 RepID=UPI0033BB3756
MLVPADRASRHRRSGLITPLEDDDLTRAMRADARGAARHIERYALRARIRSMSLDDFLACRIPGTEVHLGMSRKLYAACERLHEEDLAIAQRTPGLRAEDQPADDQELSDDAQEEQRLTQRRIFREQQKEARPRLRDAYQRGATSDRSDLLRRPQEPELDLEGDEGLLEAATPETYLAVSPYGLPPARAQLLGSHSIRGDLRSGVRSTGKLRGAAVGAAAMSPDRARQGLGGGSGGRRRVRWW